MKVSVEVAFRIWSLSRDMSEKVFFFVDGRLVFQSDVALSLNEPDSADLSSYFWDKRKIDGTISWLDVLGNKYVMSHLDQNITWEFGDTPQTVLRAQHNLQNALVVLRT